MDVSRLGPLDKSILKALLRAEVVGVPLSVAQVWRCLPAYSTYLSNVSAGLAEGSPLADFLVEARGQYAVRDQHALLLDFPPRRQRAEVLWTQIKDTVESLCREPSIHALGLTGSMAWGMPPAPGQAIELFVIATPRQGDSAEAAVRLASVNSPAHCRLVAREVLEVDALVIPAGDSNRALDLLSVRPIVGEGAFLTLWEHNPWLAQAYPNFNLADRLCGDLPDVLLAEVLEDRRSFLRRSLARRARSFGSTLRSLGRRRLHRRGAAGNSGQHAEVVLPAAPAAMPAQQYLDGRWSELEDWLLPDPEVAAPQSEQTVSLPTEPAATRAAAVDATESASPSATTGSGVSATRTSKRRSRNRRPARQVRAAAASETGQRGRGRGRKQAARRR